MPDLKFTPGPWFQSHREGDDGMYRTQVYDKNGETIASLAWYPYTVGNNTYTLRDQNAKLIAAAPELLEALIQLVYELTGEQESAYELEKGLGKNLLNKVLAAKASIKKATE